MAIPLKIDRKTYAESFRLMALHGFGVRKMVKSLGYRN